MINEGRALVLDKKKSIKDPQNRNISSLVMIAKSSE